MSERFKDGFGRVISRDSNILDLLQKNYNSTNFPVFAQAGLEIEFLQSEVEKLQKETFILKQKQPKTVELKKKV